MSLPKLPLFFISAFALGITLTGCFTSKKLSIAGIPAVENFNLDRYLGTWYEIARLPNSFEKNLDRVTATYSLRKDGKIKVVNRGFNIDKDSWKEATGKAWIPDPENPATLKVSFFWFFSSDYKIIALDEENYSYSMVTSSTRKYLWILSRTPQLDPEIYQKLIEQAKADGFDTDKLYKVKQS